MKKYESVIIMSNKANKAEREKTINKYKKFIEERGTFESIEDLGLKQLAYEVKKHKEAYYYVINFEYNPADITKLESKLRLDENIIKFIVVKKED